MKIEQILNVPFNYEVHFTHDLFHQNNPILAGLLNPKDRVVVFVDSGVLPKRDDFLQKIEAWFNARGLSQVIQEIVIIEGGEQCKNDLKCFEKILETIHRHKLDRHSYVMVVGGGSLLDAAGFAASISHRGIRQIRVPTTALSQGDSGVGVKNSFNYFGAKNYFGTFTPPFAVISDFDFLKTLEKRDLLAGIAEAFKVAIIKDKAFLECLTNAVEWGKQPNWETVEEIIMRSAELHAAHITGSNDPFETGSSRPLDFGHWSAHYLETLSNHRLNHGEAVAIGVILDMTIARARQFITDNEYQSIYNAFKLWGLYTWHPILEQRKGDGQLCVFDGIEEFRQHIGGELNLIMPNHIGGICNITSISRSDLENAVDCLKKANESESKSSPYVLSEYPSR